MSNEGAKLEVETMSDERRRNYLADGGELRWERATCEPVGLQLLADWVQRNGCTINELVIRCDPRWRYHDARGCLPVWRCDA